MGGCFFKHVHPIPQDAPILTCACDRGLALDQNKDHFTIPCRFGRLILRLQVIEGKSNIAPTRTFRCDLVDLATFAKGFFQQIRYA